MKKIILLVALMLIGCNKNQVIENHQKSDNENINETEETKTNITELGLKYANESQKVLGQNLMQAIKKDGTLGALTFCNHNAYPLTDSMATKFNVQIKRVSDKPRNPNNEANEDELSIIEIYKNLISKNAEISPITKEDNDKIHVYYPIVTNAMCLQCHGTPNQQLDNSTLSKIAEFYPHDKAQGYNVNEVRGIWNITFDK